MKKHLRTFACASLVVAAAFLAACGAEDHGSRSPAAEPVDHSTHGSAAVDSHATMDHSAHGTSATAATHAEMDHSAHGTAPPSHANMHHGDAGSTHTQSPAHTSHDHGSAGSRAKPAGHSAHGSHANEHPPGADRTSSPAHAGHGQARSGNTPGPVDHSAHRNPGRAPSPARQTESPAHTGHDPAATLRPDEFDAPAPASVAEAAKAAGGGDHTGHGGDPAAPYVCPMHPEVTSATPDKCPKCGMALVKKEK
ncbi:MAG TPA: heavy metal-binding domain-containing protein [Thermoanaerobaculia bacterium]|nr:heavy metal-binding domain-containing protein [Thermoanaerobaculia bacterium]